MAPDPFADLLARAALHTRWPTVHVHAESEGDLDRARRAIERVVGAIPQLDVIEPWDERDTGGWELRVDLPGLDARAWDAIRERILSCGLSAELRPGVPIGARTALDRHARIDETISGGGLRATIASEPDGAPIHLDLWRADATDAWLVEFGRELAEVVRSVRAELCFRTERGLDTLQPVVHRASGRAGVELWFGPEPWEHMDGSEVFATRERLVAALGDALREGRVRPFAPDLVWEERLGSALVLWLLADAGPGLPGDQDVASVAGDGLTSKVANLDGMAEHVEVHVIPGASSAHDAIVAAVEDLARTGSVPLAGATPRWVRYGGAHVFTPVWIVEPADDVSRVASALAGLDGVATTRVVPASPPWLADRWRDVDPAWHDAPTRWFLRARDGAVDRDRLEPTDRREADARDRELVAEVDALAGARGVEALSDGADAIADVDSGRSGLEWHPRVGADELRLRALLDVLGSVRHPEATALGTFGWRGDHPVVRVWWRIAR